MGDSADILSTIARIEQAVADRDEPKSDAVSEGDRNAAVDALAKLRRRIEAGAE